METTEKSGTTQMTPQAKIRKRELSVPRVKLEIRTGKSILQFVEIGLASDSNLANKYRVAELKLDDWKRFGFAKESDRWANFSSSDDVPRVHSDKLSVQDFIDQYEKKACQKHCHLGCVFDAYVITVVTCCP